MLEVYDALLRVYNTEGGSPERKEAAKAYLEMLPEKLNGRRSALQPGAELLPTGGRRKVPGLRVLANILGVDANCARRAHDSQRREAMRHGSPNKTQLGSHEEKKLLADFVTAMARQRHAQGRPEIASLLRELLLLRQTASTNGMPLACPQCEREKICRVSQDWFMRWEVTYRVAHLTKAALQSEKRAASFTVSTAARHIRQLDDKLLQLEMVYKSGPRKDQIKNDST